MRNKPLTQQEVEDRVASVGYQLRAIRQNQNRSQEAVSRRAGLGRNTAHNCENGLHAMTLATLHRIADALDHDVKISLLPRADENGGGGNG